MSEVQVKKSALSIPVTFEKLEEFDCVDKRFTKVRIWLMHEGINYNGSSFAREVIEDALPTLQYIPIVGFIDEDEFGEKDFTDHRYVITKNENGVYRKYVGSAYGVVLSSEDNNAHFAERECDDGVTRTFLVVDGIIWRMFEDSANIFDRDFVKSHSMECADGELGDYEGYEDDDGIFHFTKFSFRAACILGAGVEPAMHNSTIEVQFTMTDFVRDLQNELNDKLNSFTKIVSDIAFTRKVTEKSQEGGTANMANVDFTQTLLSQFEDISNVVSQHEVMESMWGGTCPRFYLQDIQEDEVIVVDRQNNYCYYGFPFTVEGDKPNIDFSNGNRKKIRYENYEEGTIVPEGSFDFGKHIAEIEEVAFAKVDELNTLIDEANAKVETAEQAKSDAEVNYTQIKADYDEMKPKYDEYVLAEEKRISEELNAQKDAKFAEYEDVLAENAEFAALKERKEEMSVEDIEKECAVLYVKVNRPKSNFNKTNSTSTVVGVIEDRDVDSGFVATKYGNIPVKR